MNTWQVCQQIKRLLLQRTWEGGANFVFHPNSVVVSAGAQPDALGSLVSPMCLLRPLSSSSDAAHGEEPALLTQSFGVRAMTVVPGDSLGEHPILGAMREAQDKSGGKGILEIEEEIFAAIDSLNSDDGIVILGRMQGAADATLLEGLGYIVWRDWNYEFLTTASRFYPAPFALTASLPGGGVANLSWVNPASRFDLRQIVLRRAAGAVPPATPTAGTGVTLSSDLATSVSDTPGAGTFSYSLFTGYDETGSATNERYSATHSGTFTVT